jgi:hypothetical protein
MHCACVQQMLNSHQHVRRCTSPPLRATQICILVCTYLTIWVCKNVYMCYTRLLVCSVVPSVLVVSCSTVHSRREWGRKKERIQRKGGDWSLVSEDCPRKATNPNYSTGNSMHQYTTDTFLSVLSLPLV